MTLLYQSHGGSARESTPKKRSEVQREALVPEVGDVAVDEAADFGYLLPPSGDPGDYLPDDVLGELDELGNLMVPGPNDPHGTDPNATPDSDLAPVLTYWGQFLDHELTARTDRDTDFSNFADGVPAKTAEEIEAGLKNARSPRFDLDSVYGGIPIGPDLPPEAVKVISGMRHPSFPEKMRVGTAVGAGPLPDGLDPHRDLPRFSQVSSEVRQAFLSLLQARVNDNRMSQEDFDKIKDGLDRRAIIGDMRNDENLNVAQFHLSFLRFHNRVVDYLAAHDTGWIADFNSARTLTRLHYQWLIVEGYLKKVCDPAVVTSVLENKAQHYFDFRTAYNARTGQTTLGDVLPLEFSVAAYRFGHTMVRDAYDYNRNFGRDSSGPDRAPFEDLFVFGGVFGGGPGFDGQHRDPFDGHGRLTKDRIIDWSRFVTPGQDSSDGKPARRARAIDTQIAPPLGDMIIEGAEAADEQIRKMSRHLARRNLRRGNALRLPTGQALHAHLKAQGAVQSGPIADVGALFDHRPNLRDFLQNSQSRLHERTPLWFYLLAEAEAAGGNHLGELGSWIVASVMIATLLDDPESALSIGFDPSQSPLLTEHGDMIDSIENWMKFALVLE
ncbi:peroxidase family protein [Roseovarius aestuariivivens]|uniref:peroxidase family protein n=1 Tax=Roseovarius aestuariivivens TaxID=1888910 RepID=UPI001080453B|nr:heme peroxidase family protein [Roseovarius aestuariivivens]